MSVTYPQQWFSEMSHGHRRICSRTKLSVSWTEWFKRFRRDQKGVAGIEFAMILPFLLVFLIGMVEVTDALNQDRKISRMANAVTDLVAQAQTVTRSELNTYLQLGETILKPYPSDDLTFVIASVTFQANGAPEVDWSYQRKAGVGGPATDWTDGQEPPISLPATLVSPNTSIVVGVATLGYTPPFAGIFTQYYSRDSIITLSDTYYLRPRLVGTILCTDC
ncbi:TadE/TadG family type IV pilus assembly protein [Roseibium sp.]|uniref:TadE/TadG family type IV pilus assembly protein n=1 Tax=Roseibium sp. TaxID=1936156 RepID=UPI003919DEF6